MDLLTRKQVEKVRTITCHGSAGGPSDRSVFWPWFWLLVCFWPWLMSTSLIIQLCSCEHALHRTTSNAWGKLATRNLTSGTVDDGASVLNACACTVCARGVRRMPCAGQVRLPENAQRSRRQHCPYPWYTLLCSARQIKKQKQGGGGGEKKELVCKCFQLCTQSIPSPWTCNGRCAHVTNICACPPSCH